MTDIIAWIVKPLVWEEPSDKNNYTHIAPSIFGDYYVHIDGGRHQAWLEAHVKPYENVIGEEVGGLMQGQFQAEADYRARIAAALDLGPVLALVEAGAKLSQTMADTLKAADAIRNISALGRDSLWGGE
jgi:hypothetical protein